MALSLDAIALGVPHVEAAHAFYTTVFSPTAIGDGQDAGLDLHGTGRLLLRQIDALAADAGMSPDTSGFRGCVLSVIVDQPGEVGTLLDAATANGATVVRPAKKRIFGEFTSVYRAPDGAVWKLAAAAKKDTRPSDAPVRLTETAAYLGVTRPKAAKLFYEALGMDVDRDYGDKFVDFTVTDGVCRLGLLPRPALAKDAGVDERGHGFPAVVLTHVAASREDAITLLKAVEPAGGRVVTAEARTGQGDYVGYFTDPDGQHWAVTVGA
ncbi:Predicted lactoylglutathione lyase [Marinactinospora thermotolerans DSM 45154]|uniref:Predicted lactoylglutathione lyase n=1 Tax=Marinactinospora thermotolerans DSM 45154 TaxID=1122192 RepID=A0A1T4QJT9_9ACTN|nr:VOC family protein [Marinactinospora thermotolerans]SKA04060.1 Predicted lactoylglutathione lyase [Marinactinospora thermotolerans DSM 45154]